MEIWLIVVAAIAAIVLVLQLVLLMRSSGADAKSELRALGTRLDSLARDSAGSSERLEREIRTEIAHSRREAGENSRGQFQVLQTDQRSGREETAATLRRFNDSLGERLAQLIDSNERRLVELRETLDRQMRELQADNGKRLDEMRQTVDEKLHKTLEERLTYSFRQVSDRLELVSRGLGEMQQLAAGVGDLKRVLTNVKTRGTWGEVQLGNLLEQILTPDQFERNVCTRRAGNDRVEYAIRLPGREGEGEVCYLPIDSKFPQEDYQRLLDAEERLDLVQVEESGRLLEALIKDEARKIRDKYIDPPATTDFALLFLPTEGLYAEVLRRPGLADCLQRDYRITVAGPTTLTALLNSLQMGFRTLAIERRSSEVWTTLSAVKTEFGRFADTLSATKRKIDQASRSIGDVERRTRVMGRALRTVESLPGQEAAAVLGLGLHSDGAKGIGDPDEADKLENHAEND